MSNLWSEEELKASVYSYMDMLFFEKANLPYVKKRYYQKLSQQFGRTPKSYEYRMQNISYVLSLLGREWIIGLKPARNVGSNIASQLEKFINEFEGQDSKDNAVFEIQVKDELKSNRTIPPSGELSPKSQLSTIKNYQRNASVKAWVLKQSKGMCERCGNPAPFITPDGLPFLEVHHIKRLVDHGSDTITNAVALCPNCHREVHYGEKARLIITEIYAHIPRLIKE